jgi:hypothetical protein
MNPQGERGICTSLSLAANRGARQSALMQAVTSNPWTALAS